MIANPFAFVNRLLVATAKIIMYSAVFVVQLICYALMLRRDKIVDALGYWGRGIADTIADLLRN